MRKRCSHPKLVFELVIVEKVNHLDPSLYEVEIRRICGICGRRLGGNVLKKVTDVKHYKVFGPGGGD